MSPKVIPDHKLLDVPRELSDNYSSSRSESESSLDCNLKENKVFT